MDPHAGKIVLNGAASQYDRWPRALDASYAKVDGRTYEELLDFAVAYAGLVNFYDLRDEVEGDWVPFFLTDPAMLLAAIAAADLRAVEDAFTSLERATRAERDFGRKFQLLRETFAFIHGIALGLNAYIKLPAASGGVAALLEELLEELIAQDLGAQLRTLKSYDEGAGLPGALGQPIGLDYSMFAPIWGLGHVCPDGSIYRGTTPQRKIDHALPRLDPIFRAFLYALSDLKQFALANLTAALDAGDHKPHVALYLAFARLFQTAQETVNTVSRRYVEFYYRDILRERRRGLIPDSVYLTFTLAEKEDVLSTTVPRGTHFPAGQDADGLDIVYASDKELTVTAATIGELHTLRVLSGPLYDAGSPPALEGEGPPVVRRVLASDIVPGADASAQGGWATFGEDHVGASEVEVTEPAALGFAVASNLLLLTGGTRSVMLEVGYSASTGEGGLASLLEELSAATGLCTEEVLRRVLEGAFTLYVSTAAGWFEVETYGADAMPAGEVEWPAFVLWFCLPPSVPAVVPFDPTADGEDEGAATVSVDARVNATNPDPTLPTLKAYVRQEPVLLSGKAGSVNVYPLSLLAAVSVESVRLRAQVFDLPGLQLSNVDGEVDATVTFYPFGGLPAVHSWLLVGHSELFVKTIDSLNVVFSWFNLPQNDDGFKGYYKYYVIGPDGTPVPNLFDNTVFRNSIVVENPGWWSLGETSPDRATLSPPPEDDYYLFRTRENCAAPVPTPAGALCPDTAFAPPVTKATPPRYYDPAESAVRIELTAPPYAFGNGIYAQNVLNAVIQDLPDVEGCEEKCAAECQVLSDAAACVETCVQCVKDCAAATSEADPKCERTCVEKCLLCLIELAVPCVERCLAKSGASGSAVESFRERLRALSNSSPAERVGLIQECADICRELFGDAPKPSGACAWKCPDLFEAMLCVLLCAGSSTSPTEALADCLAACAASLTEKHDACVEACVAECTSLKKELKYPNEPYLPQCTKLTLDYKAECALPTAGKVEPCGGFYYLLPFGGSVQVDTNASPPLIPSFEYPGNLYLGFTRLIPPQTLTLLFRMTADAGGAAAEPLPPVVWEYLAGGVWTTLPPSQILFDSTNGLQQTGLVTLNLPAYDPSDQTVMPAGFQWLRASVASQPDRFPRCVGLYPHAVVATLQEFDDAGEPLGRPVGPLPPQTIDSSVEALPDIETIEQPVESFGGRPPETGRDFETRVGERLRHKDRASLSWDYERLVLERFPTLWKAQALPARNPLKGDAPGEVLLVVVGGSESTQAVDPTAPFVTAETLGAVRSYLEARASPFVRLHVVNPVYVRIEVSARVEFAADAPVGASLKRLNEELVSYLSPWFYDAARAARGGRYASESDISDFVQTRPYVAALDSIEFGYAPPPAGLEWYFLTSARKHRLRDAGAASRADGRAGY